MKKIILCGWAVALLLFGLSCASDSDPWRPGMHGGISYMGKWAQGKPTDPAPTHADMAYGPHARHRLDFWQAPGPEPRPVFVYFHGGGFDWGDKWELRPSTVRAFLARGISVASCNYRLIHSGPLPQPLLDGARAVQFLRSHAAELKLDPQRVAAGGFSAGGLMALWLACHDDLVDPASADPVARQSTRLTCVAVCDAPTNLVAGEVYGWFGVKKLKEFPSTKRCFDIESLAELDEPRILRLARETSPFHHIGPGDPPVYLSYTRPNRAVNRYTNPFIWVHHPLFGLKLKEAYLAAGRQCELHYADGPPVTAYKDGVDFVARQFGFP